MVDEYATPFVLYFHELDDVQINAVIDWANQYSEGSEHEISIADTSIFGMIDDNQIDELQYLIGMLDVPRLSIEYAN